MPATIQSARTVPAARLCRVPVSTRRGTTAPIRGAPSRWLGAPLNRRGGVADGKGMSSLPPEDQPHVIDIGPVQGIPVHYEDDPRLDAERQAWSAARKSAQGLQSVDELLRGFHDADWMVRYEVVGRLIARGRNDPRTLSELLIAATEDGAWQVRDAVVMRLSEFERDRVLLVLRVAADDSHSEVRRSARRSLNQLGKG